MAVPDFSERLTATLNAGLGWLFAWQGWLRARDPVIDLVADFLVAAAIWLFYSASGHLAQVLIEDTEVRHFAESTHAISAVAASAIAAGCGLVHFVETVRR